MSKFKRHFFICQTQRPPFAKPSCGQRGSAKLVEAFTAELNNHPELWNEVQVTASGCLGPCFDGPSIVVYPEATWYAGVKPDDVKEIVESHMIGGKPVERLLYKWPTT
ncbi:MAG: (2Fe-2S) ferredoxin domain-containing protein [Deltaproteobacteria bacterium]|nr:(2Fe-2S) ferredoxin domain-containing protein [Deltaproteobacteria bacterium]